MSASPIRAAKVKVSSIVENWDMRSVHKLRHSNKARNLKGGSCLLAFNKKQSMARIIDWKGGVHTYYAEKNEVFDLNSLKALVREAFYVSLEPGTTATRQADNLREAA